jgi:fumarate reductase subunit C
MSAQAPSPAHTPSRTYKPAMGAGWWTRQRHYVLYMVREFTALPLALWLLWLLIEIKRASGGARGYYASVSTAFVAFSIVCLIFALYHSVTFLRLAGVIIRIKILDKPVPSQVIVASMFGLWLVASVVVGAVLIGFGR